MTEKPQARPGTRTGAAKPDPYAHPGANGEVAPGAESYGYPDTATPPPGYGGTSAGMPSTLDPNANSVEAAAFALYNSKAGLGIGAGVEGNLTHEFNDRLSVEAAGGLSVVHFTGDTKDSTRFNALIDKAGIKFDAFNVTDRTKVGLTAGVMSNYSQNYSWSTPDLTAAGADTMAGIGATHIVGGAINVETRFNANSHNRLTIGGGVSVDNRVLSNTICAATAPTLLIKDEFTYRGENGATHRTALSGVVNKNYYDVGAKYSVVNGEGNARLDVGVNYAAEFEKAQESSIDAAMNGGPIMIPPGGQIISVETIYGEGANRTPYGLRGYIMGEYDFNKNLTGGLGAYAVNACDGKYDFGAMAKFGYQHDNGFFVNAAGSVGTVCAEQEWNLGLEAGWKDKGGVPDAPTPPLSVPPTAVIVQDKNAIKGGVAPN